MTAANEKRRDYSYGTIAWGALFIWAGLTDLIPGLPYGAGMLGIGLILLGVNLARRSNGIPVKVTSTVLGVLAFLLGLAMLLLSSLWGFHLQLPFFPAMLIVIGAVLLVQVAAPAREVHSLD